jgi:type IV secretion system protein VirD4
MIEQATSIYIDGRPSPGRGVEPVLLVVVVAVPVLVVLLSSELATLLTGGRFVRLPLPDLLAATIGWPRHLADPKLALPAAVRGQLPGPVGMYLALTAVTGLLAAAGALSLWAWRRLREPAAGYATRNEIRDQLSAHALRIRADHTRPSLDARTADPSELGLHLGREVRTGIRCYGSVEDSFLYLGPPRSGKGVNLVIPQALTAPGPLIVTATRPDTLRATLAARRAIGPVAVFDPQHLLPDIDRLRWSPVAGCTDPLTAITRARALVAGAKLGLLRDGEFWDQMSQAVVRGYLHAAALDRRPVRDVLAWSARPADPTPVRILRDHPDAAPAWAEELAAQANAEQRQRDSVWAGVRRGFDSLADPRVLDSCSPTGGQAFDPHTFLRANGTIYLIGSPAAQLSVAPLIAALIEDIIETARAQAAHRDHGRLDPPLLLLLDEAANIAPIPSLPALLADGGGAGITTVAVLQSLAQARARWGQASADAMWDAATIKVILGGLAHADDLTAISRLAGDIDQPTETRTRSRDGLTVATSLRRLPALPVEHLRSLPVGRAVLFARRTAPVQVTLTPYWQHPDQRAAHPSVHCRAAGSHTPAARR